VTFVEAFCMAAVPQQWIGPAEYLARDHSAETKSEYVDGVEYAMAGGTRRHNRIVLNVGAELRAALRGRSCGANSSDQKVTVPTRRRYYYPDVVVVCGEPEFLETDQEILTNPVLLVEVLSETTAANDRGPKFLAYQTIPTLQEYLLISQDEIRVECFRRTADGWVYTRVEGLQSCLALQSLGAELKLSEVYLDVASS
jgi:Uma2 family endonuclease